MDNLHLLFSAHMFEDAVHYGELLFNSTEVANKNDVLTILVKCYQMIGNVEHALFLLESNYNTLNQYNRYLYVKMLYDMKKYMAFLDKVLAGANFNFAAESNDLYLLDQKFGPYTPFVLSFLGDIFFRKSFFDKSRSYYLCCVGVCSFIYSVYTKLFKLGVNFDSLSEVVKNLPANIVSMHGIALTEEAAHELINETPLTNTNTNTIKQNPFGLNIFKRLSSIRQNFKFGESEVTTFNQPQTSTAVMLDNVSEKKARKNATIKASTPIITNSTPFMRGTKKNKNHHQHHLIESGNTDFFSCLPISEDSRKNPQQLYTTDEFFFVVVYLDYLVNKFRTKKFFQVYFTLTKEQISSPPIMIMMSKLLFGVHNYAACCEFVEKSRLLYPYLNINLDLYSSSLYNINKMCELQYLSYFLRQKNPISSTTWLVTGNYFSAVKKHNEAIESFQRAIKVDPSNCYAFCLLGKEYFDAGDKYDQAISMYKSALDIDRFNYHVYYLLAEAHLHKNNFLLASECINIALNLNPEDPILLSTASLVSAVNNDYNVALNLVNSAVDFQKLYIEQFSSHHATNKHIHTNNNISSSFISGCDRMLNNFYMQKSKILIQLKRFNEAEVCLKNIDNDHTEMHMEKLYLLGRTYYGMQDYINAEKYLSQCVHEDLNGRYCVESRKMMGKIGLLHGGSSGKTNPQLDAENKNYLERELDMA